MLAWLGNTDVGVAEFSVGNLQVILIDSYCGVRRMLRWRLLNLVFLQFEDIWENYEANRYLHLHYPCYQAQQI